MRLIDANNVRDLFDTEFKETRKLILAGETHLDNLAEGFTEADRVIREMPTVDAEAVVRCRDCRKFKTYGCRMVASGYDDFCSYGERKEDAT